MSKPSLVWFITGASQGFGRILTEIALSRGDRVIATARNLENLKDLESANCKTFQLDVTDGFDTIQARVQEAVDVWGRIDVLVNNAGLGTSGVTEEIGATGYQRAFQINFFAAINVTNAVLPFMRAAKSGTIVLMGSRHAWKSQFPAIGAYSATKAALHAWGESLAAEIRPFGVRVLIVQPGAHRTNIIATSQANPLGGHPIPDYDPLRQAALTRYKNQHGKQPNDPVKSMKAVVDVVRGEGVAEGKPMPLWLLLGTDSEQDMRENIQQRTKNMEEWLDVTRSVGVEGDDVVLI